MKWIKKSEAVEAVDNVDVAVCGAMDGMNSKIRDDDCSREDASERVT